MVGMYMLVFLVSKRFWSLFTAGKFGANPTSVSNNTSVVKIHDRMSSLVRFDSKSIFK
jgi:hypothetical protein